MSRQPKNDGSPVMSKWTPKNEAEFQRTQDKLAADAIRCLFQVGGPWRDWALPVPRIEAALDAIRPGEKSRLRRALSILVREKFLRSRIEQGKRLYEAVLTREEIES